MYSIVSNIKAILPNKPRFLPIIGGPLRGGVFYANPRVSLRKVFGLYEHELNPWFTVALRRADLVVDVGANDGYFTFGCAAVMRNSGRSVRVLAFEPWAEHVEQLRRARLRAGFSDDEIAIEASRVGAIDNHDQVTLDSYDRYRHNSKSPLIKIDVEGGEIDVLIGASKWLRMSTMVMIEVHKFEHLIEIEARLSPIVGPLQQIDQRPLPFLGRETRDVANWWLASRLQP